MIWFFIYFVYFISLKNKRLIYSLLGILSMLEVCEAEQQYDGVWKREMEMHLKMMNEECIMILYLCVNWQLR